MTSEEDRAAGRENLHEGGFVGERLVLRESREDEIAILGETAARAFHIGVDAASWTQYYKLSQHRKPRDTIVAELDGEIAGHATGLDLEIFLASQRMKMMGVAAVATLPEFRKRRIADEIVRELLVRGHKRKVPITFLYAFRGSYYRRFGYEFVEPCEQLHLRPEQLYGSELRRNVRRGDLKRDQRVIRALYESTCESPGQISRSVWWWKERILARGYECVLYHAPESHRVEGYLIYSRPPSSSLVEQTVCILEVRATSDEALRGLWGFVQVLGDQVSTVVAMEPRGASVWLAADHQTDDRIAAFPASGVGVVVPGAMARLLDIEAALAAMPASTRRGTVGLDVVDPVIESQSESYDLRFSAEGVEVRRGRRAKERARVTVGALTQIYCGTVAASALRRRGTVEGSSGAIAFLDTVFRGIPPYLGLLNHF